MRVIDWVEADMLGLRIPAHAEALRAGGTAFLTEAFRAAGALAADNWVTAITQFEECPGGSTGRKLLLSVDYQHPAPGLHRELFVKFSRDFDDALRDRGRDQLELEVRFAALSQAPGFPVAVPQCFFADYHRASGTGILITQRIAFGRGAIEPHYDKCLDWELPQPLEHYRALVRALARLAGTHKAGRLPQSVAQHFPFDAQAAAASDPIRYDARQLQNRVSRFADFCARFPQLLPQNLRSAPFHARLMDEVPRFLAHEQAIKRFLHGRPELIALCHWNANIDNAWFWRDARGELECGLLDWGRVGQMNVAAALWGALSAAEKQLWDEHLDELLALFVDEFRGCGGPSIDARELRLHLDLFAATLGLAWLLDAPPLIQREIPDLAEVPDRFDPRLRSNEMARTQLHLLTSFLNLWDTHDFGKALPGIACC